MILVCALILCGIGLIALFSASYDSGLDEFKKQAVWGGDKYWNNDCNYVYRLQNSNKIISILYGISIISLIAVLFKKPISGARSWFTIGNDLFSFQPAEMSKLFIILFFWHIQLQ